MNKELEQAAKDKYPEIHPVDALISKASGRWYTRKMIELKDAFIAGANWQSANLIKTLKSYMTSNPNGTDYADGFRDAIEDCIKLIEQTK